MDNMKPASAFDRGGSGKRLSGSLWLFVVVFCLLYAPFLGQAFHIDDVGFINPSKAIGWNPLKVRSSDTEYVYGLPQARKGTVGVPHEGTHSVLMSYFIKIIIALAGEKELMLHLAFLIFPAIALICLAKLNTVLFASSFGVQQSLLYLILSMPAFLVNSHTIMSDVPSLAVLLAAMLLFSLSVENGAPVHAYAGGLALTIAVFMAYQMLAFVPVIFCYAALKKRLNRHIVASLLLPALLLAGWLLTIYNLYGVFPLLKGSSARGEVIALEIQRGLLSRVFIGKVISAFANIGASLLFALILFSSVRKALVRFLLGISALSAASYGVLRTAADYPIADTLVLSCMVATGLISVLAVITVVVTSEDRGGRSRDLFLLFWAFIVIVYNIVVLPFGAARYMLPALPPMLLILVNAKPGLGSESVVLKTTGVILACALVFGWMSSYSDYRYAQTYQDFAQEAKIFRSESAGTGTVWYIGRWGMQYYMEKEGFPMLSADSHELKKGDFLIVPEMPRFWQPSPDVLKRLKTYATREFVSPVPLRLFNRRSNAGFYEHQWGLLPFSFSRAPDEYFQIVEVTS